MQHSDRFAGILRTAISTLGVWAVYAQVSVFIGRSLNGLIHGAWIAALALALVLFTTRARRVAKPFTVPGTTSSSPNATRVLFLALCSVAGMFFLRPGDPVAAGIYVLAAIVVLAMIRDRFTSSTLPNASDPTTRQMAIVVLVISATMIATLCVHRVNWDDAKYLNTVVNTLEHPDEPMLVNEHLYGVDKLKILHPSMRLQTYELLVAAVSKLFGASHLQLYYLILPPIWGAFSVMSQWLLIRRMSPKHSGLALFATFLVLAMWGGHRGYGVFAFDFVGRGVFLTFAVPAVICATLEFVDEPDFNSWLYLFLATWAGCMFTSTAYAVVPVAVFLVLMASYGFSREKIRDFAVAFVAVAWCPVLLFYVVRVAPIVTPLDVDTPGGAHFVFSQTQGRIAIILFALGPFFLLLVRAQSARWLLRYTAMCFLILLSGFLLKFVGHYSSILSWRLLWAIPVPIIIGAGISAAIAYCQLFISNQKLQNAVAILILASIATAFWITGKTVLLTDFGWPALKIDPLAYPVARSIAQCSNPTDRVLAPPDVAVPLAGLRNAPALVAVRGHHLSYLSAQWGAEESERRKHLFNIVQGEQTTSADVAWMHDQLRSGSIDRIVLRRNDKELESVRGMLRSLNSGHIDLKGWEIWLPNTSEKEAMRFRTCLGLSK